MKDWKIEVHRDAESKRYAWTASCPTGPGVAEVRSHPDYTSEQAARADARLVLESLVYRGMRVGPRNFSL